MADDTPIRQSECNEKQDVAQTEAAFMEGGAVPAPHFAQPGSGQRAARPVARPDDGWAPANQESRRNPKNTLMVALIAVLAIVSIGSLAGVVMLASSMARQKTAVAPAEPSRDADAKPHDADSKLHEAEQKARDAEQKLSETDKKIHDAEAKATEADKRAHDAETKLTEADKKIHDAETKATEADKKVHDAEQKAHDAQLLADAAAKPAPAAATATLPAAEAAPKTVEHKHRQRDAKLQETQLKVPAANALAPIPADNAPAAAQNSPIGAQNSADATNPQATYQTGPNMTLANPNPAYANPSPAYTNPAYGGANPTAASASPAYGNPNPAYSNQNPVYAANPSAAYVNPAYANPSPAYTNPVPAYVDPNNRMAAGVQIADIDRRGPVVEPAVPPRWRDPQRIPQKQRSNYLAQIRLAQQAWDRGDARLARQYLEPYRTDADKQNLRNFAWHYLWHASRAGAVRGNQPFALLAGTPAPGWINSLAFTPAGDQLIAAGCEGTSRAFLAAWNLGDPARPRFFQAGGPRISHEARGYRPQDNPAGIDGHVGEILCAAVTASGKRIITAGADRTLKVWDPQSGQLQATLLSFRQPISCMAISPRTKQLVVGTGRYRSDAEPGELILCQSGAKGTVPSTHVLARSVAPASVAFTPDGNTLVVCGPIFDAARRPRQGVFLLDVATGRSVTLASNRPQAAAVSPDGQLLAIGCATGDIELWPLASVSAMGVKPAVVPGHRGAVMSLCFSPDGSVLASGGADQNAKIWDVASGQELLSLKHTGAVEALRFSPDGMMLATADRTNVQGNVRIWGAVIDDR